jgi:hypothetical protein
MDYDELKQAIQDYLEEFEPSFERNIPVFVKAVENRVYNEVQLPALRKNTLGHCEAGNRYIVLPPDYLSVFSMAMVDPDTGEYSHPLYKHVNLIREMYPSPKVQGRPKVFGQFDTTALILGPTPDKAYEVELHYFFYPESIVTAGKSWVATNFPSVMLYGAVAEGYRFLKGEDAQQKVYDEQYKEALNLLRKLGEGVQREDAYTTSPVKTNVIVGE